VRAQNARLHDIEGKEYIDCASAQGWAIVGHSHPEVTEAIREQAGQLVAHTESSYNDQRAAWLEELTTLLDERFSAVATSSLGRVVATNSGAEAIEAAIKLARLFTKRTDFVACRRGFHGRTLGALSATANPKYRDPFQPLVPGFTHVPFGQIEAMEHSVTRGTAGVILEAVQGEGGVHPADPDYLQAVRRLCTDRGAMLIIDEIQTGLGRTGRWFACEYAGVAPDILVLGKGLGGGIPMGAAVWQERFGPLDPGLHASTFAANPLACAASRAVLRVLRAEGLPERADRDGRELAATLRGLEAPAVREVRGVGFMIGIEVKGRVAPLVQRLMDRGVWTLPAGLNVLRLLPPLTIPAEDLERAAAIVAEVLREG
jgi:acetylornithine/LysW-gamma-L-lysine aminotransferase